MMGRFEGERLWENFNVESKIMDCSSNYWGRTGSAC